MNNLKIHFFFLFFFSSTLLKAAPFQFSIGDTVHVSSDKGYRFGEKNRFEMVGNVVILHHDETLYGETGSLEMDSGKIEVKGNVRYISPEMTMYGSELEFNVKTGFLAVSNSRILSRGYSVQGEYMTRVSPNVVMADDAEYTTCRDCPESWSVYGKKVKIILGEYIHITHALIKVNSVAIMYVPYMILPIKKGRQTGLLFPQFSLSFSDGFYYRQPWFWAMGSNYDLTMIPWSKGKRGIGNELEYRHVLGEGKWFELHSLQSIDRIYTPNKINNNVSGQVYSRHFSEYEHHYQAGNFFNHHFLFQNTRDLDTFSDFPAFVKPRVEGSEIGGGTFFEVKNNLLDVNLEGYLKRNVIVPDSRSFDHRYVQILPRLSLDLTPVTIFHAPTWPVFQNLTLGINSSYTYFRQNHLEEKQFIRNAHRISANPYLDIKIGHLGPLAFKTNIQAEYLEYHFPFEQEKTFHKRGTILLTEASLEIDRIFGVAYKETIPLENIHFSEKNSDKKKDDKEKEVNIEYGLDVAQESTENLIGDLPSPDQSYIEDNITISRSSYRHSLLFNLRHHFTADQSYWGNSRFANQVEQGSGPFDYRDVPVRIRHVIGSLSSRTDISERNAIELRIFNSLFKKEAKDNSYSAYHQDGLYLRDHFQYSKLAYFNISQGLEINSGERKFINKLTRLYVSSGFPFFNWAISFDDYYFYQTKKHQLVASLSRNLDFVYLAFSWKYNSLLTPPEKTAELKLGLRPWATIQLEIDHTHDITNGKPVASNYKMIYSPGNNCWKLDLGYLVTREDKQIVFNFLINFGDNRYTSLLQPVANEGG